MIYRILMDNQSVFGYSNDLLLVSPSLNISLNSAGSLSFKMPYQHKYYNLPALLTTDVEVYEDSDMIWYGRISEIDDTDMNRSKTIYCEGAYAFLNDTIQRPYTYEEVSLHSMFASIIQRHNDYAPPNRQFTVGTVTVDDRTISATIDYSTTKSVIESQLTGAYGGYLFFRRVGGVNYIDWLADISVISPQPVQYALNLVSLSKYIQAENIYTSIIPLGKEVNGEKTTIVSVNEGRDYIDSELIDTYGRITKVVNWDEVTVPSELLLYAERWLSSTQFSTLRIECEAAELYYLDHQYYPFKVGQLVHVVSNPHGIDVYLPIVEMGLNLDSPVKNISIGSNEETNFTGMVSGGSGGSAYSTSVSPSGGGGGGGGGSSITVDDDLSITSTNPVQNAVITNKINGLFYECTQSEYDALPDTKLSDNVIYFITDGTIELVPLTQAEYNALPDTKLSDNVFYLITDA